MKLRYLQHFTALHKFLIIRLSSIGDIVLTSPVIRCLKKQVPDAEIHFLVKKGFEPVVINNPYISKVFITDGSVQDVIHELKSENYDLIIDLHKNIRSLRIRKSLNIPSVTFNKLNLQKWIYVNLKWNVMPHIHIVDRYLESVKHLGIINDNAGLDYFLSPDDVVHSGFLPQNFENGFIICATGAAHHTKILPAEKIIPVLKDLNYPCVIIGGKEDADRGEYIRQEVGQNVFNACGKLTINQSAYLVSNANAVLSNDTGFMHIAAALKRPVVSVWGNTVPEFGMAPYYPVGNEKSLISEVKGLNCRPCSKIGFEKCPRGHFKCMLNQDENEIVQSLRTFIP